MRKVSAMQSHDEYVQCFCGGEFVSTRSFAIHRRWCDELWDAARAVYISTADALGIDRISSKQWNVALKEIGDNRLPESTKASRDLGSWGEFTIKMIGGSIEEQNGVKYYLPPAPDGWADIMGAERGRRFVSVYCTRDHVMNMFSKMMAVANAESIGVTSHYAGDYSDLDEDELIADAESFVVEMLPEGRTLAEFRESLYATSAGQMQLRQSQGDGHGFGRGRKKIGKHLPKAQKKEQKIA